MYPLENLMKINLGQINESTDSYSKFPSKDDIVSFISLISSIKISLKKIDRVMSFNLNEIMKTKIILLILIYF